MESVGEVNALAVMADSFLRLVVIESVKALVWAPLYLALVLLYARLINRPKGTSRWRSQK